MPKKPEPVPDPLTAVVGGTVRGPCEHSLAFPCTVKHPRGADWMLKWADCNCDQEAEGSIPQVSAVCSVCLDSIVTSLKTKGGMACSGCGLIYNPADMMIADVVEL